MTLESKPLFGKLISRSAMGVALAFGVVAGGMVVAEPAMAQKKSKESKGGQIKLSPDFQKVAAPFQQSVEAAKARSDVAGAKGNPAALGTALTAEKAQLEQVFAAASTPEDKYMAGSLAVGLGSLAEDANIQRRGLSSMIESGAAPAADLPRLQFFNGQLAYVAKDYAAARTALQAAVTGGFRDNDAEVLLAEAYIGDNQVPQGLTLLKQAIDQRSASGAPAPESWYRRGLGAAYNAKLPDKAAEFSAGLVKAYPSTQNWAGAIAVVRELGKYQSQETLDLMRLMGRTNSYSEERDYIEHIEAADPRRLPGESMKVIEAGLAAGKLKSGDPFITEGRATASGRVAADRASLPALERDARLASATGATVQGAADAFLSYGEPAKAEELYVIAMGKPGVDTARIQTRMGIAQADQGKYAAAQQTLAKVTGPRKPVAMLWEIYASQKAGTPAS